jgi:ABC-type maltose transport system permease subunit
MSSLIVPRIAVASVWAYQGLWCKLLGHASHHQKIVETAPFLNSFWARQFLLALGVFECVLAAWAFSGIRAREGAVVQTVLLVSMNTTALLRARDLISDPVGMLLQNCVFLILAWIAAGQFDCYAPSA